MRVGIDRGIVVAIAASMQIVSRLDTNSAARTPVESVRRDKSQVIESTVVAKCRATKTCKFTRARRQ